MGASLTEKYEPHSHLNYDSHCSGDDKSKLVVGCRTFGEIAVSLFIFPVRVVVTSTKTSKPILNYSSIPLVPAYFSAIMLRQFHCGMYNSNQYIYLLIFSYISIQIHSRAYYR